MSSNEKTELFNTIRKLQDVIPKSSRQKSDLFNIKEGSFLEYNNKTFFVKDSINYQERKKDKVVDSWGECEAICLEEGGKTYFIEVEEDDGLKVYFSHTILKLRDLNIKKSDLDSIVDEEESVFYNKKEFYYEDDYKAYINDSDEKVYFVDFEDEYGNYLTIGKYEEGETRAYISSLISNIEVISL